MRTPGLLHAVALVALCCSSSATAPTGLELATAGSSTHSLWDQRDRCGGLATGVVVAVGHAAEAAPAAVASLRLLCQSTGAPQPSTRTSSQERLLVCPPVVLCCLFHASCSRDETRDLVCPNGTFTSSIRKDNSLFGISLSCASVQQQQSSAVISFEGSEGDWGTWDQCEGYSFAAGMRTLSEESQGVGDDTALNGVQLACSNTSGQQLSVFRPHSSVGPWGTWDQTQLCPSGAFIAGFKVQYESSSETETTGLNRIMFICRSAETVTFSGELGKTSWGEWSQEYLCPPGHAVSAIQTRLQPRQGRGDDTALNGIRMRCQSTEDSCGGCLNGGTCAQTTASCQCTADFGGQHCEIDRTRRLSFNSQNKFRIVQFTAYDLGVRGMFVGHDHKNDFCGALADKPQLLMCYGRKSGYGYYNPEAPMYRGARVIELTLGPAGEVTMDTWIRDERGHKITPTVCVEVSAARSWSRNPPALYWMAVLLQALASTTAR
eukprot:m51a1_g13162 hypothetical protein (491) ;mRNA; r:59615-62286